MNKDNPKFFIYVRKSTDDTDRQVRSIGDQVAELHELAARESLNVVEEFSESQTAKKPGRPIFNKMLERIERGEASGILAWHPDRLARNSLDAGRIIWLVDAGHIQHLKFPLFRFEPSAQGKFMLAVMFGQSKYFVDNLSENIRRGQRQKVRSGIWPQHAPVGYLNDRRTKTIVPDPERAPLVRKTFELHATGTYTLDRLVEAMNGLGMTGAKGEPLSRAQYHRLLSNPIYCSIIRYSGELHEGKHEPIVTKNLFDRVQAVMSRKSKPKTPQLKPYVYRGVFRCGECGCFITTETQKGHNYLRCTKRVVPCSQRCLREESATQQVAAGLAHVALPEDWADWMIEELETKQQQAIHEAEEQVAQMQRSISGIDEKLELLMTGYLDKAISLPEYQIAKNRLVEEKRSQTDQLIAMERNRSKRFEPVIRFIKASKKAGFLSKTPDTESQRDFLKKTGSNHRLLNRELLWEPRGAWKTLVDIDRLARHSHAASCDAACVAGEIGHIALKRREWESKRPLLQEAYISALTVVTLCCKPCWGSLIGTHLYSRFLTFDQWIWH